MKKELRKSSFLDKALQRICLRIWLVSFAQREGVRWTELFISAHCQGLDVIMPASDQFWVGKYDFKNEEL